MKRVAERPRIERGELLSGRWYPKQVTLLTPRGSSRPAAPEGS